MPTATPVQPAYPDRAATDPGTIIAFCNLKGGVGKSTTAIALAYYLKFRHGKAVTIVDTDAQQSTAQWASYLHIPYQSFVYADILTELAYLKGDYDYVIVDAPSVLLDVSVNIMRQADWVLVPTKPNVLDLNSTGDILTELETIQLERRGLPHASIFLSMGKRRTLSVGEAQTYLTQSFPALTLAETIIFDRACIADSFGQQGIVWQMPKNAAVKKAIADYETLFNTALGLTAHASETTPRRRLRATKPAKTGGRRKAHAHAH